MNRTLETAPWPDFAGNPIREGDTIRHPTDGVTAVVFVLADETDPNERWRVLYGGRGDGWPSMRVSRLCLQIGHRGQAVVVRGVSSPGHSAQSSSPRGTSEEEEVQCSTAGGTMPPNPADCSIGEGSGSACLEPAALAKYPDDLRRDSLRYYMQGHLGQSRSVNRFGLLDKLAAEHRERRDSAWEAILCHGHAPVPFNPETWTGASHV